MARDSGKRQRRRRAPQDGRDEILQAAAAALSEYEWRELTVARVMARTTLARSSFYRYFDGLVDLLLQLAADLQEHLLHRADREQWQERTGGVYDSARAALAGFVVLHERHAPIIKALLEASYHEPVFAQARSAMEDEFTESTATWIADEMASGRADSSDPRLLASALTAMTEASLVRWGAQRPPVDREARIETLLRIWIGAIYGLTPQDAAARWSSAKDEHVPATESDATRPAKPTD